MYIYCMICYRVIPAPYVRSVLMSLHTVALDEDSECPIDYELSLLPNVFPLLVTFLP